MCYQLDPRIGGVGRGAGGLRRAGAGTREGCSDDPTQSHRTAKRARPPNPELARRISLPWAA